MLYFFLLLVIPITNGDDTTEPTDNKASLLNYTFIPLIITVISTIMYY